MMPNVICCQVVGQESSAASLLSLQPGPSGQEHLCVGGTDPPGLYCKPVGVGRAPDWEKTLHNKQVLRSDSNYNNNNNNNTCLRVLLVALGSALGAICLHQEEELAD